MIQVPDKATLPAIAAIRDCILRSLDTDAVTIIDLSGVTAVDLSFVQVVEAARRQVRDRAQRVRTAAPASPLIADLLQRAGFLADPSDDDIDFWFHGVLPQ